MTTFRVHAGPHDRRCCPVSVPVDLDPNRPVSLVQQPGRRPRACQLLPTANGSRLWWTLSRLDAGTTLEYRLVLAPRRRRPIPRLRWEALGADQLQVNLDGQPLAGWDTRPAQDYPGLSFLRGPSTQQSWPGVTGTLITAPVAGRLHRCTSLRSTSPAVEGPVLGQVSYDGFWRDEHGKSILEAVTLVTFYATPEELRLIDLQVDLRASVGPVGFAPDLLAGLLVLDLAALLHEAPDAGVRNSTGLIGRTEVNEAAAFWLHIASDVGGLAVFDHPANPGSPCCWRFDGPGRLAADPFLSLDRYHSLLPEPRLLLAAGDALTFRYRFLFHAGRLASAAIQRHYLDYAQPPRVELLD